jgi:TonB family protein
MRVLVVDQDSASNLGITRSLRDLCAVDCVTNKADCLDLLRSNTFEVIVATERLADGSGLELLGQISKKWPAVLRIFAADRKRLQLLRGRLGPFRLFQTLSYPIDPQKLIATLEIAAAAQGSDIQEVELPSEAPAASQELSEVAETPAAPLDVSALDRPLDLEQSDEFSAPRFARAGRAEPMSATASGHGASVNPRAGSASAAKAARSARARRVESKRRENDPAAKFPGSGTIGPRRGGRGSGKASKAPPPVRFPSLEQTPPQERGPSLERAQLQPAQARKAGGDLPETAAMARAARSNYETSSDELDTKRLATLFGGGVAVAAIVLFLGFKMFSSKNEAPKLAPPVVAHAPEYPPEVTQLVAQTEAALKADDFKAARADVERLRHLSPSHPRLAFFQGLLAAAEKTVSAGRRTAGASKKNGAKGGTSSVPASKGDVSASAVAKVETGASSVIASSDSGSTVAPAAVQSKNSLSESQGPAPQTPVGLIQQNVDPSAAGTGSTPSAASSTAAAGGTTAAGAPTAGGTAMTSSAPAGGLGATTTAASAQAPQTLGATAQAPQTPAATATAARRGSGEPPPVIQEAKLIRRVNPDYPSAAKKDALNGAVDLDITVSPQGVVENVSVTQATPPDMFDKSAVAAVRKWKYDPRFVDGLPSQAHLKVHLEFGPNR